VKDRGKIVIDSSGTFDFGHLMPSEYDVRVTLPGQDAVFVFVIDPSANGSHVFIDVSPAYIEIVVSGISSGADPARP
jgi:hypothetical protein